MPAEISNVLASRYASEPMKSLWSATGKIILEREFWIAVMKAQKELGVDIGDEAIESSLKAKGLVDLKAIQERERAARRYYKLILYKK